MSLANPFSGWYLDSIFFVFFRSGPAYCCVSPGWRPAGPLSRDQPDWKMERTLSLQNAERQCSTSTPSQVSAQDGIHVSERWRTQAKSPLGNNNGRSWELCKRSQLAELHVGPSIQTCHNSSHRRIDRRLPSSSTSLAIWRGNKILFLWFGVKR